MTFNGCPSSKRYNGDRRIETELHYGLNVRNRCRCHHHIRRSTGMIAFSFSMPFKVITIVIKLHMFDMML